MLSARTAEAARAALDGASCWELCHGFMRHAAGREPARWVVDGQGHEDGRREDGERADDEHRSRAPADGGDGRTDRGPQQEARHLRGAVEPERLAATISRRGVQEEAARGGVVERGGEAGEGPKDEEGGGSLDEEGKGREDGAPDERDDHERGALRAVGETAEERLGDQTRGRPCRDDDAEGRNVDAPGRHVQRQDRQENPEAEPDNELRRP